MSVICKEAYFNSSNGEDKIRCLFWRDDDLEPTGVIQISHGLWANVTLHKTLATYLASCGFIVYAMDFLGHGKSVSTNNPIGDLPENADMYILNDVHSLLNIVKKRHPDLPLFLLGDGFGCCINTAFINQFSANGIDGLIFCSMPYLPEALVAYIEKYYDLAINVANIPAERKSSIQQKLRYIIDFDEKYDFKLLHPILKFISEDTSYIKNRLDPSLWFPYSYRAWLSIAKIAKNFNEDYWMDKVREGFPVLLLSGVYDSLGLNNKFESDITSKMASKNIDYKLILYPNNSHDLINSMDNEKALQDMLRWLFGEITK